MRAIASVYVVLFHAVLGFPRGELQGAWRAFRRLFAFGHEAVAVFIVLSGYCLMLPVVRDEARGARVELGRFIARRARRVLPPYYVTLALSLASIAAFPLLRTPGSGTIWDDSLPGLTLGSVASHVVLLHNWFPAWAFQINGPLWSVATEWQIYFFFPLLLLPVWRRFGLPASLGIASLFGYLPLALLPASAHVAIPWYLALFALGMGAAAVAHTERATERWLRTRVAWRGLTASSWIASAVGGLGFGSLWFSAKPVTDLLLGIATASFLVYAARANAEPRPTPVLGLLSSPPVVLVGRFSYSLYLTHLPLLAFVHFFLLRFALSAEAHAVAMPVLGTAASLGFAWCFYWLVERHFVRAPAPAGAQRPSPI